MESFVLSLIKDKNKLIKIEHVLTNIISEFVNFNGLT